MLSGKIVKEFGKLKCTFGVCSFHEIHSIPVSKYNFFAFHK